MEAGKDAEVVEREGLGSGGWRWKGDHVGGEGVRDHVGGLGGIGIRCGE